MLRKVMIRLAFSVFISLVLVLWLSNQGFDVFPSRRAIEQNLTPWAIPVYVGLFSVFHFLRAWRWTYLLKPFASVSLRPMFEVAFTGFVAIQLMPLRTGEVARPYLLDRYTGVSKSALFGTIAIERVVDGLLVSLWLTAALFTVPSDTTPVVWSLRFVPLLIFAVALFLLIAFYVNPELIRKLLQQVIGRVSPGLAAFSLGVLERFHKGLAALPDIRSLWGFLWMSGLYWGINALSFWVLARGCGLDLPFVGAVAGMGCLAVGILLPSGPGYFGNFQVAVLAALEIYLLDAASSVGAAVFVFLLYILQTGLTVLFGFWGGMGLRKRSIPSRLGKSQEIRS